MGAVSGWEDKVQTGLGPGRWPLGTDLRCHPAEVTKEGRHLSCFMFLKNGSPRSWVAPGPGQMTTGVLPNGSGPAQLAQTFLLTKQAHHTAWKFPILATRQQKRTCFGKCGANQRFLQMSEMPYWECFVNAHQ